MPSTYDISEESTSQSHKGYSELNNNRAGAKKSMSMWIKFVKRKKSKGKELKTLDAAGRKLFNVLVDNRVLQWIYDGHKKHLKVSYALLMKKAMVIYNEFPDSEKSESFIGSRSWLDKLMSRHWLSFLQAYIY